MLYQHDCELSWPSDVDNAINQGRGEGCAVPLLYVVWRLVGSRARERFVANRSKILFLKNLTATTKTLNEFRVFTITLEKRKSQELTVVKSIWTKSGR